MLEKMGRSFVASIQGYFEEAMRYKS